MGKVRAGDNLVVLGPEGYRGRGRSLHVTYVDERGEATAYHAGGGVTASADTLSRLCRPATEEEVSAGVRVSCYGTDEEWADPEAARAFYAEAYSLSDGAERARYASVLIGLAEGRSEVSDRQQGDR